MVYDRLDWQLMLKCIKKKMKNQNSLGRKCKTYLAEHNGRQQKHLTCRKKINNQRKQNLSLNNDWKVL